MILFFYHYEHLQESDKVYESIRTTAQLGNWLIPNDYHVLLKSIQPIFSYLNSQYGQSYQIEQKEINKIFNLAGLKSKQDNEKIIDFYNKILYEKFQVRNTNNSQYISYSLPRPHTPQKRKISKINYSGGLTVSNMKNFRSPKAKHSTFSGQWKGDTEKYKNNKTHDELLSVSTDNDLGQSTNKSTLQYQLQIQSKKQNNILYQPKLLSSQYFQKIRNSIKIKQSEEMNNEKRFENFKSDRKAKAMNIQNYLVDSFFQQKVSDNIQSKGIIKKFNTIKGEMLNMDKIQKEDLREFSLCKKLLKLKKFNRTSQYYKKQRMKRDLLLTDHTKNTIINRNQEREKFNKTFSVLSFQQSSSNKQEQISSSIFYRNDHFKSFQIAEKQENQKSPGFQRKSFMESSQSILHDLIKAPAQPQMFVKEYLKQKQMHSSFEKSQRNVKRMLQQNYIEAKSLIDNPSPQYKPKKIPRTELIKSIHKSNQKKQTFRIIEFN